MASVTVSTLWVVFNCKAHPILALQKRPPAPWIHLEHAHGTRARGQETFQDLDRCGLTRAIRAKQSYHLSRGDLEADVIDGSETAIALQQILDNDSRHDRNAPLSPP
jgi:DNA-binding transcriptional LysR family regulator